MRLFPSLFSMLLLLVSVHQVYAQPVRSWQAWPSLVTINELIKDDEGRLWAATEGGLFSWKDTLERKVTTLEGLYLPAPTAMAYHSGTQTLWLGFSDGMIQVYSPATGRFERLPFVERTQQFSRREINRFLIRNDSIFTATGFGIVVLSASRRIVLESYTRFAQQTGGVPVAAFWIDGTRLYAATQQGVVRSIPGQPRFIPDAWEQLSSSGTPAGASFTAVYASGTVILATVSNTTYRYENNRWVGHTMPAAPVRRFEPFGNQILALGNGAAIGDVSGFTAVNAGTQFPKTAVQINQKVFIGTTENGILVKGSDFTQDFPSIVPDGPSLNAFSGLSSGAGVVISGSSSSPGASNGFVNTGYYEYKSGAWTNYNLNSDTTMRRKFYTAVYLTHVTDTYVVTGSYGSGLAIRPHGGGVLEVFNRSNSPMYGLANSPDFIVVNGIASDRAGVIWTSVLLAPSFPLFAYNPEKKEWASLPYASISGGNSNQYSVLLADSFEQVWVSVTTSGGAGNGLLVLQPGDLTTTADDKFVHLTESNANLPASKVTTVVQDRRGEVWIGTTRGVARFPFPELIISGGSAERQAQWLITEENGERFYFLRDLNTSAMVVNEANQKWIGSNDNGLWLVNEDGSNALHHFTRSNSPLISNTIQSLAAEASTGQLFIATPVGLVSYVDVAKAPEKDRGALKVYPNPFSYSKNNGVITIDGLPSTSVISIMASDGTLVRRFDAASGRTSWDARDGSGGVLNTGVYIVVAKDRNGSSRRSGKVIITR
jgi:ligand-binding sensor domain-containing protein